MSRHLTSFGDFERHCRDERKHAGYGRLFADFGIDPGRFAPRPPRLVFAEQPGCWLGGEYLMRALLLRRLAQAYEVDAGSGVLSLANDGFSDRGVKRHFLSFDFHPRLGPVRVVGAAYVRRHRNRVYGALSISGSAHQRLAALLDTALALVDAAAISGDAFAREARALLGAGVRAGLRALLPSAPRRPDLHELGATLRHCDLEAARRPLAVARNALVDGVAWATYWDHVNGVFLDSEIRRLDPWFNGFLLAVDDPVRMARRLIAICCPGSREPIPVATLVAPDTKFRMVFFDPVGERFFYSPRPERRVPLDWSEVRDLAGGGFTGGPAGVLEYLLMAASGIYLVADPDDGGSAFERQARQIHERYTGLPFPSLTYPSRSSARDHSFLEVFGADFTGSSRAALDAFFATTATLVASSR